jgi:hypothetical protein
VASEARHRFRSKIAIQIIDLFQVQVTVHEKFQ